MKKRSIVLDGFVDKSGKVNINEKFKMDAFSRHHKGLKVTITIDVLPEEASKLQIARYFKKMVPDFQAGYKNVTGESLTLEQADLELRKMSAITTGEVITDDGILFDRIRKVNELSRPELVEFMSDVEMLVGREFGIAL